MAPQTYKNTAEDGATRVEFGIEWQAVEQLGAVANPARGESSA
jgi:hypothetical protein